MSLFCANYCTCKAQKAEYSYRSFFCEFVKNEATVEMAAADHQNGGSQPSKWQLTRDFNAALLIVVY
eukprot:5301519-Ditylum_brightwellii.AAC.1